MEKITHLLLSCFLLISVSALMAQDHTQLGLDIANAQEKNREKLMGYSWQRSAKAYMNGEEKVHTLVKVWFNTEGKMENSVLSSESSVTQQRGVRGRMQQSKGQELGSLLEQSVNLSIKYIYLSKGNWIDLLDRSEVKVDGDVVKIDAKDVLVQGDVANYVINNSTKLLKSIKFSSKVNDKPISGSVNFKTMSNGTNRPVQTEIAIPSESLKITTENLDYIKQQ